MSIIWFAVVLFSLSALSLALQGKKEAAMAEQHQGKMNRQADEFIGVK